MTERSGGYLEPTLWGELRARVHERDWVGADQVRLRALSAVPRAFEHMTDYMLDKGAVFWEWQTSRYAMHPAGGSWQIGCVGLDETHALAQSCRPERERMTLFVRHVDGRRLHTALFPVQPRKDGVLLWGLWTDRTQVAHQHLAQRKHDPASTRFNVADDLLTRLELQRAIAMTPDAKSKPSSAEQVAKELVDIFPGNFTAAKPTKRHTTRKKRPGLARAKKKSQRKARRNNRKG